MKIGCLISAYIFLIYLLPGQGYAGAILNTGDYTKEQVHGVEQECDICHVSHKMKDTALLKKPISELCLECHPDSKAPSEHVVDVVPSMKVERLPLTDGKMTCITCHDSHKNTYENMIRIDSKNLCQSCHRY